MILCKLCNIKKLVNLFYISNIHISGLTGRCKSCINRKTIKERQSGLKKDLKNQTNRKYYYRNRLQILLSVKKYQLKRCYGLSLKQLLQMYKKQKNQCKICLIKKPFILINAKSIDQLHIDHDHKTGKIRGLLCKKCNLAIGYFNDEINLFHNAIKYLRDSQK